MAETRARLGERQRLEPGGEADAPSQRQMKPAGLDQETWVPAAGARR